MKNLINWIKPSVEGKDGKASARALTNIWYVFLNTILSIGALYLVNYIVTADKVNVEAVNALWVLIRLILIFNITILIIFGIVTAQNINEGIRAIKGSAEPIKVVATTKTETEITQVE